MKLKHILLAVVLAASCGKTKTVTEGPGGYVIRVHLDSDLAPSGVGGLEVVVAKDGGFLDFSNRTAGAIQVTSSDTDGDSENEVVLTWPSGFAFAETQYVRLVFDNEAAMPITIMGTATDDSGGTLATGSASETVPAGGVGVADLTLDCVVSGCTAVVADGGDDMGIPDAGPDVVGPDVSPDMPPDVEIFPDTTLSQVGQTVTAAGRSKSDGGAPLELDHQVGNVGRHVSSSDGGLQVESVLTITR